MTAAKNSPTANCRAITDGLWVLHPTEMTTADACIDLQSVKLKIDPAMLFADLEVDAA